MSREIDFSKPLDEDEAQYVAERPWLRREAEFQGIEVRYESDTFEESDDEDDEGGVDYSKFVKKDLLDEIARRNEEREDEEDHIVFENDKNDTLIAALEADDEENEETE